MPQAVVLSHRAIAHELGPLGDWLADAGFAVDRVYREDVLPLPDADLLIVLGSPHSVAEGWCAPAGEEEIALVRTWLASDRPYLGICFGAQVLARATGGRVDRLLVVNRGWALLEDTDARDAGDFGGALAGPWMVWHEDAITAAPDAQVRARFHGADQVFSVGRAWGVQFHPELDSASLTRMATALGADESDYQPLVDAMAHEEQAHHDRAVTLFETFWAEVTAPQV